MSKSEQFELTQYKPFRTAKLFAQANADGELMPIIFSDATFCIRLIFRGILTDIEVADRSTKLTFGPLKRIHGKRTQELVLRHTGKQIADNYIRPYAVCRTPEWLHALAGN